MYNEIIFRPLYNVLVSIMDFIPGIDVGIAVIIFTAIVRLVLYPLSKSSLLTQVRMKEVEPEAAKIRNQYANDKQTQAMKIMELYKVKKIKPFAGVLLLIIQLPILLALISIFYKVIPTVDPTLLYHFIHVPTIKATFLGLNLTSKNIVLAIITAVVQFLQLHFSLASRMASTAVVPGTQKSPQSMADMSASTTKMMKYFVPVFVFISLYWLIPARYPQAASIIAIYWSTSALFTLLQELYIRKRHLH